MSLNPHTPDRNSDLESAVSIMEQRRGFEIIAQGGSSNTPVDLDLTLAKGSQVDAMRKRRWLERPNQSYPEAAARR